MKKTRRSKGLFVIAAVLFAIFVYTFFTAFHAEKFAAEREGSWSAAGLVLLLFTVKSVTVFVIPPTVLYLTAGLLFQPVPGGILLLTGMVLQFCINYAMGAFMDGHFLNRYFRRLFGRQRLLPKKRHLFLLRFCGVPPTDLTSVYLGSIRYPFQSYLLLSLAGTFPRALLMMLIGQSVKKSGESLYLIFTITVIIFLLGWCTNSDERKSESGQKEKGLIKRR